MVERLIELWLIEVLKGIGRIFLHPLLYYLILIAIILGVRRVKKEREQFHIRINDVFLECKYVLTSGLLIGLIISIVMLFVGVVVPFAAVILFALITFLLSLSTRVHLLAPTFIIGVSFFSLILIMNNEAWTIPLFSEAFSSLNNQIFLSVSLLLGLLLIGEAILIFYHGGKKSSPKLVKSKRGLQVGIHEVKRLWMVPVLLLIPGGVLQAPFPWWPVFSIGEDTYSLFLVPFAIGFFHQSKAMLPKEAAKLIGKRLLLIGVMTTGIAAASYYYPLASIIAVTFAIIFREMIFLQQRTREEASSSFFTKQNKGVKILGVIPQSPADKMGLQLGESILRVNGISVKDKLGFYRAIQRNSAHCKLEVIDQNGEIRFTQRALYEGDHHELGVLFVQEERNSEEMKVINDNDHLIINK